MGAVGEEQPRGSSWVRGPLHTCAGAPRYRVRRALVHEPGCQDTHSGVPCWRSRCGKGPVAVQGFFRPRQTETAQR